MKIRKEFIIGIVASFTLIAFYWGFSFLKGNDIFSKEREFVLIYDKVAGLNVSNPVIVNGLKVGKVSYVNFIPNDQEARILVKIKISNDIAIPSNTVAIIKSDLLGVNTIELNFKTSSTYAVTGDTLDTRVASTILEEVSMQMLPIKIKAEDMMSSLDSVLEAVKYIFNEENKKSFSATYEKLRLTIYNLEHSTAGIDLLVTEQSSRLDRIFANVESITRNLNNSGTEISSILNNFSDISDSLAQSNIKQIFTKMDKALNDVQLITDKVSRGEGSLGQLVNNDTLYSELEAASAELNSLLEDIKLHPSRYVKVSVFGGKNNDAYEAPKNKKEKK